MDLALPDIAVEFPKAAEEAFEKAGGIDWARRIEAQGAGRAEVEALLVRLGVPDIDARSDLDSGLTAGELCRAAGRVALPYPIPGWMLAREGRNLAVVEDGERVHLGHGDLGSWALVRLDGRAWMADLVTERRELLFPFGTVARLGGELSDVPASDVALWLALDSYVILGGVERALLMSAEHIKGREQFGVPLSTFQALRFRLADAIAGVRGLEELAHYTMWRLFAQPRDAIVDALALRTIALEVGRSGIEDAHQFHGALGFCDEDDLSILSRHLQQHFRLPWQYEATTERLMQAVESRGIETLFGYVGGTDTDEGDTDELRDDRPLESPDSSAGDEQG